MSDALRYGTFLGLVLAVGVMDWRRRAVWRGLPILGTALGTFFASDGSWAWLVGLLLGFVIPWCARLPLGDMAVGAMLGAWVGPTGILLVWSFALASGLAVWVGYRAGWWTWPGDWPFTPFLLVPACAIVLAQSGG